MIDAKAIIQMIAHRQRRRPWLARLTNREAHPSTVPMFRLWQTPEYLVYLVERELHALDAAGVPPTRGVQILPETFSIDGQPNDGAGIIECLWSISQTARAICSPSSRI